LGWPSDEFAETDNDVGHIGVGDVRVRPQRIQRGRIAEHWRQFDGAALVAQLQEAALPH
jgi:hypothetical protein